MPEVEFAGRARQYLQQCHGLDAEQTREPLFQTLTASVSPALGECALTQNSA